MDNAVTMEEKDERMWAMLCHLSALSGFIGVPFGSILGPLIIWLIKKEESAFVDDQGKESLNFQISVLIYGVVCAILVFVFIDILLAIALVIFGVVMTIIAAINANKGETYRYPLCIRLIS